MEPFGTYGWRPPNKNEVTSEGLTILKRGKILFFAENDPEPREEAAPGSSRRGGREKTRGTYSFQCRPEVTILIEYSEIWILSILDIKFCGHTLISLTCRDHLQQDHDIFSGLRRRNLRRGGQKRTGFVFAENRRSKN